MNKHNSFYKIFSLLLAATMLIGLLLFSALSVTAAEPHIVFTIGDAAGKPGDTVEIPISVTGDTEISGLVLYQITYDKNNLEFLGFGSYGELITANAAGESAVGKETITLGYSTDPIPNGTICTASFRIKDTAPDGNYTVSFSIYSASRAGKEVSNTLNDGTITVFRWLEGDFDNNGVVDMQDAVHFIGWINFSYIPGLYPMIYDGDKDFDHNGVVDIQDAVYFIGWVNFSYIPDLYDIKW